MVRSLPLGADAARGTARWDGAAGRAAGSRRVRPARRHAFCPAPCLAPRSPRPRSRLEMVIAESGGKQGPHLDVDEANPEGVYFTAHK